MDRKTAERVDAYTQPLREKYPVSVFLTAPPLPITSVSEGDSPALGPADAPVTVVDVESLDFGMPMIHRTVEEGGVSRMRPAGKLEIPPGGELRFEPGGLHLMLMRPLRPLAEGDVVDDERLHASSRPLE